MYREVPLLNIISLATCISFYEVNSIPPNSAPDSSTPSHLNLPALALPALTFDAGAGASAGASVEVVDLAIVLGRVSANYSYVFRAFDLL